MSRLYTVLFLLCAICSNIMAQVSLLPVSKKALYEKSSLYYTEFDKLTKERSLPIGVFDSGTGGFTVLERMLQQDRFNNKTGKEEPDGIADFSHEDFEYLADQANMPYGRYESENKGDYLRELAVKDALFLINGKYWKDKAELLPSGKKKGVKILVIACNTATAYGLEHIQNLLKAGNSNIKVIGVVNAGSASAIESLKGKAIASIGVLATPGTISTGVYERTLHEMAPTAMQIEVVSQPGYGFAEAVDEEKAFVNRSLNDFSEDYRGPKVGTSESDINIDLWDAYHFDIENGAAFVKRDINGKIVKIQLNSAENYARYNLLSLLEQARKKNVKTPISRIILGCTHYPFTIETLKKHLAELKKYRDKKGNYPYATFIDDECEFIDPAVNTAYECYKVLLENNQLNDKNGEGQLEPFISVASSLLPAKYLDSEGNLTYAYKYGREVGTDSITTVNVHFSDKSVSGDNLSRIARLLPLCAEKIDHFMKLDKEKGQEEAAIEKSPFTPWTLFVDIGVIAILLLIGKVIRVKFKIVQKLFIPPSLIAGFLGLAFGPNGFGILPLSDNTGVYAGILIACVFSCLPFSSTGKMKSVSNSIGRMWVYSQAGMLAQWTLGGIIGVVAVWLLWPDLSNAFGLALPAGFCGGHGTAAAIGTAFQTYGYDDMLTLAMTSATVGIIAAVIIGLAIVKWGTKRGYTSFLTDFKDLPDEYRVGLLPPEKRLPIGFNTCSSISIDSLTFHFAVIMMVALGGYGLSKLVQLFVPQLSLPVFSCAFLVGIVASLLFHKAGASKYLCVDTVNHLSGAFTDVLVACGISSIKLSVVMHNLVPLLILIAIGLLCTFLYVFLMARRIIKDNWFEKAMFSWGWFTGTMAMGIALLRVVDPEHRSHCLEDYALAYLFIAPVEICLVTFAPIAFMTGWGWLFVLICFAALTTVLLIGKIKGWMS